MWTVVPFVIVTELLSASNSQPGHQVRGFGFVLRKRLGERKCAAGRQHRRSKAVGLRCFWYAPVYFISGCPCKAHVRGHGNDSLAPTANAHAGSSTCQCHVPADAADSKVNFIPLFILCVESRLEHTGAHENGSTAHGWPAAPVSLKACMPWPLQKYGYCPGRWPQF